jgi:hypothetical protein
MGLLPGCFNQGWPGNGRGSMTPGVMDRTLGAVETFNRWVDNRSPVDDIQPYG